MFARERRTGYASVAALAFGALPCAPPAAAAGVLTHAKDKLLACLAGANLNCGKANTRRSLPGASEFCRANPNADNIPMAATGHDAIYAWRCFGRRAVAAKAVVAVDPEGYDAGNWKEADR